MNDKVFRDGSADFSYGVNGARTPTLQTEATPRGLPRSALAWLRNGVIRGGGISQRPGWSEIVPSVADGLYQGGFLYEPPGAHPYLALAVSGELYKVECEAPFAVTKISNGPTANPPDAPLAYFCQAEEFLIVQAGDAAALPVFWDGATIRRSNGLTGLITGANISEIPAAMCMVYYGGRLWYARDRIYTAGDIVRGPSGTAPFGRRDSVLRVTENPLAIGGDGFAVPTSAGNIRALTYPANIDTSLGQGPLLIGTRKAIYSLNIPVTRTDWTAMRDSQPQQVIAQVRWGPVGDRCVTHVNGDVFYQTLEPGIRSLAFARRNYGQWANAPLSKNVDKILRQSDRSLLRYSSGINFDNRLWQTALPEQTASGVIHKAIVPMDFDPLSSLEEQLPPVWEGHYEGLRILQLFEGDFGGLQRAFAVVLSDANHIQVWELSRGNLFENGDNRIEMSVETPAFTWPSTIGEMDLKRLVGGEIHFDQVYGQSEVVVEYRPDYAPCWIFWHTFKVCSARTSEEDSFEMDYPVQTFRPGYLSPAVFPNPPAPCQISTLRPSNIGTQFQIRVTVLGRLRIRSVYLYAERTERNLYYGITC